MNIQVGYENRCYDPEICFKFEISRQLEGNATLFKVVHATPDYLHTKSFGKESWAVDAEYDIQVVKSIIFGANRTQLPPRATDATRLQRFREHCTTKISDLETQINNIRSEIIRLCYNVAQLSCRIIEKQEQLKMSYTSWRAPIHSLPSELLSIIFHMCLNKGVTSMSKHQAPLLLTHVCKTWRGIVVYDPMFWNSPCIEISNGLSISSYQNFVGVIRERSQGRKLSLRLHDTFPLTLSAPFVQSQLVQLFPPLFPTCQRIDLGFRSRDWYDLFLQVPCTEDMFANLESLAIDFKCPGTGSTAPLMLFKDAPKLREISLDLQRSPVLDIILPYQQLSSLKYYLTLRDSDTISRVILIWKAFLRICQNLQTIEVISEQDSATNMRSRIRSGLSTPPIPLIHTRQLSIANKLYGNLDLLLQCLHVPALKSFKFNALANVVCQIVVTSDTTPSSTAHFTLTHLAPKFASLVHLSLIGVFIANEDLIPVFRSTPNLCHLTLLNYCRISLPHIKARLCRVENTMLVSLLTSKTILFERDGDPLLPNLLGLHLYHGPDLIVPYTAMVKARSEINAAAGRVSETTGNHFDFMLSFHPSVGAYQISFACKKMQSLNAEKHCIGFTHDIVDSFANNILETRG